MPRLTGLKGQTQNSFNILPPHPTKLAYLGELGGRE